MEINEGFEKPAEKSEDENKVESKKIRISVFFDGTLNNRTNINTRLVSEKEENLTEEEKETAKELKESLKTEEITSANKLYKSYGKKASFQNGYTNIARLQSYVDSITYSPYDYCMSSYIEGAGTLDNDKDLLLGYALGVGAAGVLSKRTKAVDEILSKSTKKITDKTIKIELVTLDVFGFSRGAATARSFIFSALLDERNISARLEERGYSVGNVEVKFAGLYDTVSSFGISFSDDTEQLHLDAISHAKEVVHLASADEHRKNFSLTNIKSANGVGREIFLPGVHSDIGGSYRDGEGEDEDIYWTAQENGLDMANEQIDELIGLGWYKEGELTLKRNDQLRNKHTIREVNVRAKRKSISNMYSRITLYIMKEFAENSKIKFDNEFERDQDIPSQLLEVNKEIKSYVEKHKKLGAYSSRPEDWCDNRIWLRELRHDYFHFSARYETGNEPRFVNGKRKRMYFDG